MNKGDIVLVPFPFTDLTQTKLRPAIIIWADSQGNDVTLCFISSQEVENLSEGEFAIYPSDPEFKSTGLKVASKVRVTKVLTIERKLITRRLGKLGISYIRQLNLAIIQAFQLD
ncbi:MAG: type II toxin-antitoxin system PemK/MazF family toxin [Microcoleaceae cyanobacterium]